MHELDSQLFCSSTHAHQVTDWTADRVNLLEWVHRLNNTHTRTHYVLQPDGLPACVRANAMRMGAPQVQACKSTELKH